MTAVGRPMRRREDPSLLRGRGKYVDDIAVPGLLHIAFARSPYAHARLTSIDVSAARALPGVVAAVTAEDVAGIDQPPLNQRVKGMQVPPNPALASGAVHAPGVPVAAVVAESRAIARDAAGLVEAEYEPLDGIADAWDALQEGAPRAREELASNVCFSLSKQGGDVDAAFAAADHVTRLRVFSPRVASVTMEPRVILCVPDPLGDGLTIYLATQSPFRLRADLARVIGLPENRVRVVAPNVGGAFGTKNSVYREDAVAAYMALQLGRPVKWASTRSEDFLTQQQGRDLGEEVELALKRDGTMLGLKVRSWANLGGYLSPGAAGPPQRVLNMSQGAYRIPAVAVELTTALTNTPSTGAYRGAGRPETVLLIERLADEAARDLGMDPLAFRRKNFIPPDAFPYKNATGASYDSGDYEKSLRRALELADYEGLLRRRDAARARGEIYGVGVATFVEPSGGGGFESGSVRIERSGAITAVSGSSAQGQGHETVFAQVVADRLGVDPSQVVVLQGDTQGVTQGVGTYGSRSAIMGGSALSIASERLVEKAKRIAAHLLEAAPEDVTLDGGRFSIVGTPDRGVSWSDIAAAAYRSMDLPEGEEAGLEATSFFQPEKDSYGFGAHVAAVRIDRETGSISLEKLVCVDDCGVILNPLVVEGQVLGGIAQGLGQAFMEQVAFDLDGQVLSGTLGDYAVPLAADMPTLDKLLLDHTVTPSPRNPLGVKGVGESGTIGAPAALANAVVDALSPYGIRQVDMPFTAHRIWQHLRDAGAV